MDRPSSDSGVSRRRPTRLVVRPLSAHFILLAGRNPSQRGILPVVRTMKLVRAALQGAAYKGA
jgi:hypothetical protein